jgi:hypothetical protein
MEIGISLEGSTPEVHRAMPGGKADFGQVVDAPPSWSPKKPASPSAAAAPRRTGRRPRG